MSIEGKHSYRFGYLRSEEWKTVRIEALARECGRCQICSEESISNDAHHIWYPENIYETRANQLVILCRPCHDFIHSMMPDCKTGDEEQGRANWLKFSNAIKVWRAQKIQCFQTGVEGGPSELRKAYLALKNQAKEQPSIMSVGQIIDTIRDWGNAYEKNLPIDTSRQYGLKARST